MPVPAGSGTSVAPTSGPLAYDPVLSRVRLSVSGLMDGIPVRVDRSTDEVRWTAVRGGGALLPVAGAVRLDDYEFAPDVANHYRVIGPAAWDTFDTPVSGGWGTAGSGQVWTAVGDPPSHSVSGGQGRHTLSVVNATQESRLPVSFADLDVTVHGVGVSAAATGAPIHQAVAAHYDASNYLELRVFRPTAGAPTIVIRHVVGGVETFDGFPTVAGATNTSVLSMRLQAIGSTLRGKVWLTGQPEPEAWLASMTATHLSAGAVAIRSLRETGNTNAGVVASYDSVAVTTPEAAIYSGSIVPTLGGVWLKSLARPFLNRQVVVRDFGEVTRPSRSGIHEVVGRSDPVAVTDVRGSRQWQLLLNTYNQEEADDLDLLLASGDILLVHVPPNAGRISAVPGGYVVVGDSREMTPPTLDLAARVFELPCKQVAAPGPDVVGATSNWQTVLNTYATWADLLAAHSSWASVLELVGDPEDVIVS